MIFFKVVEFSIKRAAFLVLLLLGVACLNSCNVNNNEDDSLLLNTNNFEAPVKADLNLKNGYVHNVLTGDTILPELTYSSDTIITGQTYQAKARIIDTDTLPKPEEFKIDMLKASSKKVFDSTQTLVFNEYKVTDKVPTTFQGPNFQQFYPINMAGDTIPTGKKLPLKAKKVLAKNPIIIPVSNLRRVDNADVSIFNLGREQGLLYPGVIDILQDKRGDIWLGLLGGGVARYDGKTLSCYSEKQGLFGSIIHCLYEDHEGNIWMGGFGGLTKYDGKYFTNYNSAGGLTDLAVSSIVVDAKSNVWIQSSGCGISKIEGNYITHYGRKEGLLDNLVNDLDINAKGELVIGCSTGVCIYDGKSFRKYYPENFISTYTILDLDIDKSGVVWLATTAGLMKFDGNKFNHAVYESGNGFYTSSVKCSLNGKVFIGGDNCFKILDNDKIIDISEKKGFKDLIRGMELDENGDLWIGTQSNGLYKLNNNSFSFYTSDDGLKSSIVMSITEDKAGNVWFGTRGFGINKFDGNSVTNYSQQNGFNYSSIGRIIVTKSNSIWMTYLRGALKMDSTNCIKMTPLNGLIDQFVRDVYEDSKGNIWFIAQSGICKFDGRFMTWFGAEQGLKYDLFTSIVEDKKGIIWLGTQQAGLCKFDGKSFTYFSQKEGLSSCYVADLKTTSSGHLLIGTNGGGLNIFDGKKFIIYGDKQGVIDGIAFSIVNQNDSVIWLSGTGVTQLKFKQNTITKVINYEKAQVQQFQQIDGLKSNLIATSFLDSKNNIWWGSDAGIEKINVNDFGYKSSAPKVNLRSVSLNEVDFDFNNLPDSVRNFVSFSDVNKYNSYPHALKLNYDWNQVTLHFSATDWEAPHDIKYQYKLTGVDQRWSKLSDATVADYKNLPSGKYTFKLRAIGKSQLWSKPIEFRFEVLPPWWQTIWFGSLMVCSLVFILFGLFRWRTAALRERQKQLEKTVEERTAEVLQQKEAVEIQKELIEEKQKEIIDSIKYAKRIQEALLPNKKYIEKNIDRLQGNDKK